MRELALVGGIVALLIFTGVGVTLVGDLADVGETSCVERFGVSNPTVDKTCNLEYSPVSSEGLVVRYYNGTSWSVLTSGEYSVSGSSIVVDSDAMD